MINIEITEIEAQNLVQLIELAIKSVGSQAARVGVPLQDKIAAAAAGVKQSNGDQPKPE